MGYKTPRYERRELPPSLIPKLPPSLKFPVTCSPEIKVTGSWVKKEAMGLSISYLMLCGSEGSGLRVACRHVSMLSFTFSLNRSMSVLYLKPGEEKDAIEAW